MKQLRLWSAAALPPLALANRFRQVANRLLATTFLLAFAAPFFAITVAAAEKPKVRAITGFVRLDRAKYREQIAETLGVLRRAKSAF